MINGDLLKYNIENKKFVVFDLEGVLNQYYSQPFQIAYSTFHGRNQTSFHSAFMKWDTFLSSKRVIEKTRITEDIVNQFGKSPKEELTKFANIINNPEYLIVGHNILNYDTMVIYNCMKRLNIDINYNFLDRCYDTNAIFKGYELKSKINYSNFLAWQYSMNSIIKKGLKSNVGYVCNRFDIEHDENLAHRADYDIDKEAKIFFALVDKIDIK